MHQDDPSSRDNFGQNNSGQKDSNTKDNQKDLYNKIENLIKSGDFENFRKNIDEYYNNSIFDQTVESFTKFDMLFNFALRKGRVEFVRYFLEKGYDDYGIVTLKNSVFTRIVQKQCENFDVDWSDTIKYLIEKGDFFSILDKDLTFLKGSQDDKINSFCNKLAIDYLEHVRDSLTDSSLFYEIFLQKLFFFSNIRELSIPTMMNSPSISPETIKKERSYDEENNLYLQSYIDLDFLTGFKKEFSNEFQENFFLEAQLLETETHPNRKPYFGFSSNNDEKLAQLRKLLIYAKSQNASGFVDYIKEKIDELEAKKTNSDIPKPQATKPQASGINAKPKPNQNNTESNDALDRFQLNLLNQFPQKLNSFRAMCRDTSLTEQGQKEIKKALRKLQFEYHSDKHAGTSRAKLFDNCFAQIQNAHAIYQNRLQYTSNKTYDYYPYDYTYKNKYEPTSTKYNTKPEDSYTKYKENYTGQKSTNNKEDLYNKIGNLIKSGDFENFRQNIDAYYKDPNSRFIYSNDDIRTLFDLSIKMGRIEFVKYFLKKNYISAFDFIPPKASLLNRVVQQQCQNFDIDWSNLIQYFIKHDFQFYRSDKGLEFFSESQDDKINSFCNQFSIDYLNNLLNKRYINEAFFFSNIRQLSISTMRNSPNISPEIIKKERSYNDENDLYLKSYIDLGCLKEFKKEYSNEFRTQYFTHQKPYFGFSSDKNEKLDQLNKLSIYAKSKRAWSFAGYIQEEIDELERNQGKDEINQARSQAHKRTDHKNKKIDRNPYLRRKYIKTGSMLLALSGVLATLVVLNHFAIINVPPISLIICLSATIIASAWQFWSAWRTSKGDDIKVDKKLEDPSIKNAESSHEEKAQQKPYSSPQR